MLYVTKLEKSGLYQIRETKKSRLGFGTLTIVWDGYFRTMDAAQVEIKNVLRTYQKNSKKGSRLRINGR